jgi:hypothetical protein
MIAGGGRAFACGSPATGLGSPPDGLGRDGAKQPPACRARAAWPIHSLAGWGWPLVILVILRDCLAARVSDESYSHVTLALAKETPSEAFRLAIGKA